MVIKNPFSFGEVVIRKHFCNRKKEIEDITRCIRSSQNMFIYANRRIGKTSLVEHVLSLLKDEGKIISIWVDVQKASSPAHFLEVYATAVSQALLASKTRLEKVGSFFKRLIPSFQYNPDGSVSFSFEFSKTTAAIDRALEEVFEIPQIIAANKRKCVVVVFDEFQEIASLNGHNLEKKLRAFIQHHRNVCYIFMGSKTHFILEMFSDAKRAFYKSGMVYPLGKIAEEEWLDFVARRFLSTNKTIAPQQISRIYQQADGIPYYIQMISYLTWNRTNKEVTDQNIDEVEKEILRLQSELFQSWHESASPHQRSCLTALSQSHEIFSNDVRLNHNLGPAPSVQTSIKTLMKEGLVQKEEGLYQLTDPFFKKWLVKERI